MICIINMYEELSVLALALVRLHAHGFLQPLAKPSCSRLSFATTSGDLERHPSATVLDGGDLPFPDCMVQRTGSDLVPGQDCRWPK